MHNILVAEDNHIKQENIKKVLIDNKINFKIFDTYTDCWNELEYDSEDYTAMILDMSMPRYKNEEAYKLAGFDILKRMYYMDLKLPVIILTGHIHFRIDNFTYDLKALSNKILLDNNIIKADIVQYNNKSKSWETEILNFIKKEHT